MRIVPKSELLRVTRGVIATILLGSVGSGFWELFLKDWINNVANSTLSLISMMWGGYLELLHAEIGILEPDTLGVPLFAALVFSLMFYPWAAIGYIKRKSQSLQSRLARLSSDEPDKDEFDPDAMRADLESISQKTNKALVPLGAVLTLGVLIISWQTLYTRNAHNWAGRSIEILAPEISEIERLQFRAQLRKVNSSKDFYNLADHLKDVAHERKISLPSIVIIGHK